MAVRASMVVKSGLISVGQKQMDRFSLVIRFSLLFWLTLGHTEILISTETFTEGMLHMI